MSISNSAGKRCLVFVVMALVVTGVAFAQYSWGDIVKDSQRITMDSSGGVGYGEVAEGFASFAIDVAQVGPLTLEVIVTEERPGAEYQDDDSWLWLFTADGLLVAENDDGPYGNYQSLINGAAILNPGRYYAVVTTHPNQPDLDNAGQFAGLSDEGLSSIAFELHIEYGMRDVSGYAESFSGGETVTFYEDFASLAEPLVYNGTAVYAQGTVGSEVVLYRLSVNDSYDISAEVYDYYGQYADTMIYLIDELGYLVAQDDDSGYEGGSLIPEVSVGPESYYYIAVTSYPNSPNVDEFGLVEGFPATGSEQYEFELVIDGPKEPTYDEYGYGYGGETEIWFDEFPQIADTISYNGSHVERHDIVEAGANIYRLEIDHSQSLSVEVVPVGFDYTDTVLFLMDPDGYLISEDDDGGMNGGSLLADVYLDGPAFYYIAVVSYPNWPNTDSQGYVEGFPMGGEGSVQYDLIIDQPKEYAYDEEYYAATGPDGGFAVYDFGEMTGYSSYVPLNGGSGIGYGEVGTGFAAFSFHVDGGTYLTLEVVVTDVLQGTSYSDSDSKLALFGPDGLWYGTDDDSAGEGQSMLASVWIPEDGTYYAIVTTYPNEPATDMGYFDSIEPTGGSRFVFELHVSTDFAAQ